MTASDQATAVARVESLTLRQKEEQIPLRCCSFLLHSDLKHGIINILNWEKGSFVMNKKKIVIYIVFAVLAIAAVATVTFFAVKSVNTNKDVARISNEIGNKYGITDFKSKSTDYSGRLHLVKLYSDTFYELSNEDMVNLIAAIATNDEIMFLNSHNYFGDMPLSGNLLMVISNDTEYFVVVDENRNSLTLHCGSERFYFKDATSYGYSLGKFYNAYGTEDTICAHIGCDNKIARTGDTNCCIVHSNRCGECYKYIDEDAMFCMECIEGYIKNN